MLLALFMACSPDVPEKVADTGDIILDSSGWTPMGCEPDGIYSGALIEEEAGSQPWMLSAWMQGNTGHWLELEPDEIRVVDEYYVVEVDWPLRVIEDGCGLWVLALG